MASHNHHERTPQTFSRITKKPISGSKDWKSASLLGSGSTITMQPDTYYDLFTASLRAT